MQTSKLNYSVILCFSFLYWMLGSEAGPLPNSANNDEDHIIQTLTQSDNLVADIQNYIKDVKQNGKKQILHVLERLENEIGNTPADYMKTIDHLNQKEKNEEGLAEKIEEKDEKKYELKNKLILSEINAMIDEIKKNKEIALETIEAVKKAIMKGESVNYFFVEGNEIYNNFGLWETNKNEENHSILPALPDDVKDRIKKMTHWFWTDLKKAENTLEEDASEIIANNLKEKNNIANENASKKGTCKLEEEKKKKEAEKNALGTMNNPNEVKETNVERLKEDEDKNMHHILEKVFKEDNLEKAFPAKSPVTVLNLVPETDAMALEDLTSILRENTPTK